MAVRRDENGQWRYRIVVKHPDGSKERISGTPTINNKLAAEKAERDHIARTLNPPPKKKEVPTFKEFAELWWKTYPAAAGNRATTQLATEDHLQRHLIPHLGSVRLDQIKGLVVDQFFATLKATKARKGKTLSEKTRKNIRGTLHKMLVCAVDWELLDAVPKLPRIKVPEARFDFYTKTESEVLLKAARNAEEHLQILFALSTGARVSEQLAIEWGDLDFKNKFIVIRRATIRGETGPTKSGKERKVPMSATLEAALKKARHLRGPRVFCDAKGKPLEDWQFLDRLHVVSKRAGLRQVRWHDLRHSFASQLVMANVPILQVKEWLGHSTIAMTMRYAHLAPNGQSELIKALDYAQPQTAWQPGGNETSARN